MCHGFTFYGTTWRAKQATRHSVQFRAEEQRIGAGATFNLVSPNRHVVGRNPVQIVLHKLHLTLPAIQGCHCCCFCWSASASATAERTNDDGDYDDANDDDNDMEQEQQQQQQWHSEGYSNRWLMLCDKNCATSGSVSQITGHHPPATTRSRGRHKYRVYI